MKSAADIVTGDRGEGREYIKLALVAVNSIFDPEIMSLELGTEAGSVVQYRSVRTFRIADEFCMSFST